MAFHDKVDLNQATWTLITINDVTSVTLQNLSNDVVKIKATIGVLVPENANGAWLIMPFQAINASLADIAEGMPGANRVYAWSESGCSLTVTHG